MVGPATDKRQAQTHWLQLYVRAVIESKAWPNGVRFKRKVANRDWVDHQACCLLKYI